ncbi:MAG: hypothetical protein WCH46_05800 [bacterium]
MLKAHSGHAQSTSPKPPSPQAYNTVYGELSGYLFNHCLSINYERSVTQQFWVRVGYGSGGFRSVDGDSHGDGSGVMIMAEYLSGERSKLELGLGAAAIDELYSVRKSRLLLTPAASLGYRFQPFHGGMVFRIGLTYDFYAGLPIQISLGYAF